MTKIVPAFPVRIIDKLSKLPTSHSIRTINPNDPADVARHDSMVSLVTQMPDLNKRLQDPSRTRKDDAVPAD